MKISEFIEIAENENERLKTMNNILLCIFVWYTRESTNVLTRVIIKLDS